MSAPRTAAEAPRSAGVLRLRLNLALVIGGALTALFIAVALLSLVWTPEVPTRENGGISQNNAAAMVSIKQVHA